jgi:hypothetical protein
MSALHIVDADGHIREDAGVLADRALGCLVAKRFRV